MPENIVDGKWFRLFSISALILREMYLKLKVKHGPLFLLLEVYAGFNQPSKF